MEQTTRDWMDLITDMIWVIERETKFTLRGIHDDFKHSGLSFDVDFRKHFLQFILTRVAKTYDQFQLKLEFEELENRYDSGAMDSDGSFVEWQQSTKYHRGKYTLERPNLAQKRKNPDSVDACNRTFLIKRPRIDGPMEMDMEIENEPSIEGENIDEATNPQIEDEKETQENDIIVEPVELIKEMQATVEAKAIKEVNASNEVKTAEQVQAAKEVKATEEVDPKDDDCLISTKTIAVDTDISSIDNRGHETKSTKRKISRRLTRSSSAHKRFDDTDNQRAKAQSAPASILAKILAKPGPASVKKARIQALTSTKDPKETTKASKAPERSSNRASAKASSAEKTNQRSIDVPTQLAKIIVNGKIVYKCGECDYSNSRRIRASMHMLDHRERPFRCHVCIRRFTEQDLLDIHLKSHENKCSKCHKKFKDKAKWTKHEKTCKSKSYQCYLCGLQTEKYRLIQHMCKHTGEKPLHCELCPMKFAYIGALRRHERLIHN